MSVRRSRHKSEVQVTVVGELRHANPPNTVWLVIFRGENFHQVIGVVVNFMTATQVMGAALYK